MKNQQLVTIQIYFLQFIQFTNFQYSCPDKYKLKNRFENGKIHKKEKAFLNTQQMLNNDDQFTSLIQDLAILIQRVYTYRNYNYPQKIMLNYYNFTKTANLEASLKVNSTKQNSGVSTPVKQKRLAFKPNFIEIPKSNKQQIKEGDLTPKTARSSYNVSFNPNGSFYKSSHVTPDKNKIKKELSSINIKIEAKSQNCTSKQDKQKNSKKLEFKTLNNDTSRKIIKNVMFKQNSTKNLDEVSKLRQTVTPTNSNSYKSNYPPKPIKTQLQFGLQPSPSDKFMRKKLESEYAVANKQLENHPKFFPRNHLRNKTSYDEQHQESYIKIKQPYSQNITPRISQQKLTKSVKLKQGDQMSATDPSGSYFQKVAIKRLSSNMNNRQKFQGLCLSDFQLGACKGQGRFGKVFPAIHKKSGFLLAIKQVKKQAVRSMLQQFTQQLKINLYLNHSNIVKVYAFFHDSTYFYILMEYMEQGSLYKFIKMNKKLEEDQVKNKLIEICEAVKYIHASDILHRDIKPENIVLSNGVCKLCDFGWAIYSKQRRTTYCGTLDYVCPEILQGQSYDNFVDIWAIGVLAFEMLTGKAPFYHISRQQTMKSIMKCNFAFPEQMPSSAKSFITQSLQKNPDKRVTIQQLLKDKFLSDSINLQ